MVNKYLMKPINEKVNYTENYSFASTGAHVTREPNTHKNTFKFLTPMATPGFMISRRAKS